MSFDTILESIVAEGKGILGAALMESDGIPIAQAQSSSRGKGAFSGDLTTTGVEFGRIIGDIAKASDSIGGGTAHETVVVLTGFTLIFHRIEDDILLVLALAPDGNLGQARYLIRRNLMALRHEL